MLKLFSFEDAFFQTAFLFRGTDTIKFSPHALHLMFTNNKTKSKKIKNKQDEPFADFDFVRNEVKEQAQIVPDYNKIMCNKMI